MMNIGYGVTVLARGLNSHGIDGIGTYTHALADTLLKMYHDKLTPISFGIPFDHQTLPKAKTPLILRRFDASILAASTLPFNILDIFGSKHLIKENISIFHATDHLIPKLKNIPVVATLCDTIPISHPEWIRDQFRRLKLAIWKKSINWANHIITISEFSKQSIIEYLNIAEHNISVIYPGVDQKHFEIIDTERRNYYLKKRNLEPGFFLFIGTLQPRKNLNRLIAAHTQLSPELRRRHPLVVAGRAGWNCDEEIASLKSLEEAGFARWLNYLEEEELNALKQSALALTFPSLSEGFGLPVIEAFAAGLPVICSNVSSLPEVANNAARLVDPKSISSIHEGLLQLIEDPGLTSQLRERGYQRAREFSWENCAKQTYEIYKKII